MYKISKYLVKEFKSYSNPKSFGLKSRLKTINVQSFLAQKGVFHKSINNLIGFY